MSALFPELHFFTDDDEYDNYRLARGSKLTLCVQSQGT